MKKYTVIVERVFEGKAEIRLDLFAKDEKEAREIALERARFASDSAWDDEQSYIKCHNVLNITEI